MNTTESFTLKTVGFLKICSEPKETKYLDEYENIDELNELGHALLEVRDKGGLETFEAALVLGKHTGSVKDLINLTQNLDLYRF